MTIEDEIAALLAKAEPLRLLPDDEPAKAPLTAIVDRINELRADQAAGPKDVVDEQVAAEEVAPRRKPGRPPKAAVEGADAE